MLTDLPTVLCGSFQFGILKSPNMTTFPSCKRLLVATSSKKCSKLATETCRGTYITTTINLETFTSIFAATMSTIGKLSSICGQQNSQLRKSRWTPRSTHNIESTITTIDTIVYREQFLTCNVQIEPSFRKTNYIILTVKRD